MRPITLLHYSLATLLFPVVKGIQKLPNETVLKTFKESYPKAKFATWQKFVGGIWEVAFVYEYKEYTARYSKRGEWLGTRSGIESNGF